jgi:aryl-alcohol dehydrogenase-like predicted oxidoreductase
VAAFTPEALNANMPLLALVREWAKKKGVTPAQFSLGWLLAQKRGSCPSQAQRTRDTWTRTSARRR